MLGNDVAVFVREFSATHSKQHDASSSISTSNSTYDTVYQRVMNSCLSWNLCRLLSCNT